MASSKLADEELDDFLQELGVLSSTPSAQAIETESSLDHLVDEIIELTQASSPSPAHPSLPALPVVAEKKKQSKSIIWITATLLTGLFAGCAFGFFWAKSEGVWEKPIIEPQEEITTQISHWIDKLTNLYEQIDEPEKEAPPEMT